MMETFAEAWVAANTQTPLTEAAADGHVQGSDTQLGMFTSTSLPIRTHTGSSSFDSLPSLASIPFL